MNVSIKEFLKHCHYKNKWKQNIYFVSIYFYLLNLNNSSSVG